MSSLFTCVVILPFAYFFYSTEEDIDYKSRFCTAFKYEMLTLVIFSIIHFPMFASMRHAYIPVESVGYKGLEGKTTADNLDSVFLSLDDASTQPKGNYLSTSVELDMQLTFA